MKALYLVKKEIFSFFLMSARGYHQWIWKKISDSFGVASVLTISLHFCIKINIDTLKKKLFQSYLSMILRD